TTLALEQRVDHGGGKEVDMRPARAGACELDEPRRVGRLQQLPLPLEERDRDGAKVERIGREQSRGTGDQPIAIHVGVRLAERDALGAQLRGVDAVEAQRALHVGLCTLGSPGGADLAKASIEMAYDR